MSIDRNWKSGVMTPLAAQCRLLVGVQSIIYCIGG